MMLLILVTFAVLFLGYSNGANDNFKGVATLFGSGAATYRTALAWATVTTLAGSLLALWLASSLVTTFSGRGLVPDDVASGLDFLFAVSFGAAGTILLATILGLPVSTTHALTGALVGAGLLAAGEVRFTALGTSFLLPLLLSPIMAMVLTIVVFPLARWSGRRLGISRQTCVCVGTAYEEVAPQADGSLLLVRTGTLVTVAEVGTCIERYQGRLLGIDAGRLVDGLHFLSAGAVGFARGLNDTPKIVAILLAAQALAPELGLVAVAVVMGIGGILNARKVAETMSKKITRMDPGQGLAANLVTALMVIVASRFGLPVSTTHVSCGSLFGIGAVTGTARWRIILTIVSAWLTTLPLGAAFAAATYGFLQLVGST